MREIVEYLIIGIFGYILPWGVIIFIIARSLWYIGLYIWTKLYFKYFWYNDYKKISNILKGKNNENI